MASHRESLAVLRQRDFRLVFGAFAVSVVGDRMVSIALAFAVLGLGGSPSAVGLVLAARNLPLVASLLVGGVVADRVSRRAVMVSADLARLGSQGALGLLLILGSPPIWSLAALSGVTGMATGFFNPASTGLLPAVVAPEYLQPANGLQATARSGGEILGPALAGVLVASAGSGYALAIDAATFAVSAAFLARLHLPAQPPRAKSSFLHDLRAGWGAFTSRSWVWSIVAGASVANLLWAGVSVLGPVLAERDLGGAAVWGTVMATLGVGALAGALLAIRARPRRPLVVALLVLLLFALPPAMLAIGAPVPVIAAATFLAGGGMMFGSSLYETTFQRRIPADVLSRVSAYDWFGSLALQPLGLAIWGPIGSAIGVQSALWIVSALLLVSLLAPLSLRSVRTMA